MSFSVAIARHPYCRFLLAAAEHEAFVAVADPPGAGVGGGVEAADVYHEVPWLARYVRADVPGVGVPVERLGGHFLHFGGPARFRFGGRVDGGVAPAFQIRDHVGDPADLPLAA